jgi:hypothetical protein|tara:strand:+ start:3113 stop:3349 length:237 start_codon:yes stop_codon:yes gene_type:complete
VVGEEIGAQAQFRHFAQLCLRRELGVGDGVAVVRPWVLAQDFLDGFDGEILRQIAVAVHVYVEAGAVERCEPVGELVR